MTRARGAALLIVLWLLMLLAGVIVVFAATARTEAMQGGALRAQAAMRHAAEAGVEVAALRMADPDPMRRWYPDGRAQAFAFDGVMLEIRVLDEAGKVDLNAADGALLSALMVAVGLEDARARRLAGAIQDFRDPDDLLNPEGGAEDREYAAAGLRHGARDQPLQSVAELQQVLGMDFAAYRALAPYVTVYTGQPRPRPEFAATPVLQALGLAPAALEAWLAQRAAWVPGQPVPLLPLPGGDAFAVAGSGTYSVASRATRPDGSMVEVTATLRIGAGTGLGQLYAPLAWRAGDPD